MMSYINETDFVIENKELVYPEIVTDGLQLYYDAKGKRDTDYHRDTMLDMSGNKNHGKLHNFAYEKHSGYKDGLVFDYIDDKLVRPALNLKPDDFTFMLNGNIISFSPDGTVKRVQDGEVIESKGFNVIKNGDFSQGTTGWGFGQLESEMVVSDGVSKVGARYVSYSPYYSITIDKNKKYFISSQIKNIDSTTSLAPSYALTNKNGLINESQYMSSYIDEIDTEKFSRVSRVVTANNNYTSIALMKFQTNSSVSRYAYFDDLIFVNLTDTFGAGNEPTKEQMDEIINRFGFIPNAKDLIDRIEYKGNDLGDMENIIDGLYKTEVLSGEEIYTDKADDSVVHVEVDGKSYQHAGSGKNIFANFNSEEEFFNQPHITSANPFGNLPIRFESNKMIIPAATTTTRTYDTAYTYFSGLNPNTTYTFSYQLNTSEEMGRIYGFFGDSLYISRATRKRTFTTDDNGKDMSGNFIRTDNSGALLPDGNYYTVDKGRMSIMSNINMTNSTQLGNSTDLVISNFQLEENSDATAYEPPAPSPDYPIEIHSVNDFDVVSSVGKRNLLALSNMEFGGFNYLTGNNGLGRPTTDFKRTIELIPVSPETEYYLWHNLIPKEGSIGIEIAWTFFRMDKTVISGNRFFGQNTSIRTPSNARFIKIRFGLNQVSWDNDKYLLIRGSTNNIWVPALEDITHDDNHPLIDKINLLLDEPLRSVGYVKDRLFRDSDGLWKIERNVGAEILDSSSSFTRYNPNYDTDLTTDRSFFPYKSNMRRSTIHTRTTHFIRDRGGGLWFSNRVAHISNSVDQFHINFPNDLLGILPEDDLNTRNSKIRAWLEEEKSKGTPLKIQYELNTPTIETLDQELQDKLNNLRSFQGSNYVYTVINDKTDILSDYVADNLKPTLHAKFLYNNWYKEDRVINNLMIYNRALTNEEMLQNYKTIKRRWRM